LEVWTFDESVRRGVGAPTIFSAPYWTLAALSAGLATVPWIPRRFSLRMLLLATTLVAVVLGLAVAYR
jgi:hypothetical protein